MQTRVFLFVRSPLDHVLKSALHGGLGLKFYMENANV